MRCGPLILALELATCRQEAPAVPDETPAPVTTPDTAKPAEPTREPTSELPTPAPVAAGPIWPSGAPEPQTNCPSFLDPDNAPAFDECSVSEALFGFAGLCPGGDTNCMQPCRTDVYFVDRDDHKANVIRYRYEGGHLVERTREHPFDMGADGTVSATDRYVYEDGRLMKVARFSDLLEGVPAAETRYEWTEDGHVSGYTYWEQHMAELEPIGLRQARRVDFHRNGKGQVVRMKSVITVDPKNPYEVEMRYRYDARGRLVLAENDTYQFRYEYDGDGLRPRGESTRAKGNEWVASKRYVWNAAGQLERVEFPSTKEGDTYEYDEAGRLVAHHPIPADELSRRIRRHIYECP